MRKAIAIAIPLALGLIGSYILLIAPYDGPHYKGHTLYHWLSIEIKTNTDLVTPAQADEAFKAAMEIGTNGIPWLVSCVRNTSASSRHKLIGLVHKLPPLLNPGHFICNHLPGKESEYRSSLAIEGFRLLGTNAAPALPDLCAIMNATNSIAACDAATIAIAHLGRYGLPPLIAGLDNTNHHQRRMAAGVIGSIMWALGTNVAPAIPSLTRCTRDPDRRLAVEAESALDLLT